MADDGASVLLPLAGTIGQVVDVQADVIRREVLDLNITRKLDEQLQDSMVRT